MGEFKEFVSMVSWLIKDKKSDKIEAEFEEKFLKIKKIYKHIENQLTNDEKEFLSKSIYKHSSDWLEFYGKDSACDDTEKLDLSYNVLKNKLAYLNKICKKLGLK